MNIWIFYAVIFICSIAVVLWSFYKENQVAAAVIAAATIIFTRSLQVLNPYREFGDSYSYWQAVDAILQNGFLDAPQTSIWYPGVTNLLSYPWMHITTSSLVEILGIESMPLARAILPSLYAVLFFSIVVALSQLFLGRNWAVVSGYVIAQMDSIIFYQTEYHSQSFGLLFVVLTIFVLLRALTSSNYRVFTILAVVSGLSLSASHRFSSALMIVLLTTAVSGVIAYERIFAKSKHKTNLNRLKLLSLITAVMLLSVHVFLNTYVLEKGLGRALLVLTSLTWGFASAPASLSASTPTLIDQFSLIIKALLVAFALPTLVVALKGGSTSSQVLLFSFLAATGLSFVLTALVSYEVVTRVILIAMVPLVLTALLTVRYRIPKEYRRVVASGLIISLVMMGSMSGTNPSLIDPSSDIRADGFNEIQPMSGHHTQAGYWMRKHATTDDTGVTAATLHVATTFGHQSLPSTEFLSLTSEGKTYVIVDDARRSLPAEMQIYSNGRVLIGRNSTRAS